MSDVRHWLRNADPVADDPSLSEVDAQRMRRAVIAAGDQRRSSFTIGRRTSWAAATLVVVFTVALGVSRWLVLTEDDSAIVPGETALAAPPREAGTRRQLQFSTPGGTRVIWIFNADFEP